MFEKKLWEDAQKTIEEKENKDVLYFLEFTTQWCTDCKMMKPIVREVYEQFANNNKIKFIEVDAEEANLFRNPNSKFQVLRVPTHVLIKNNHILRIGHEYYPKEVLIDWVEEFSE